MSDEFSLKGRVALITGSTAGLGKAIAMGMAKAGAKVVVNYCNDRARAQRALQELTSLEAEATLERADVTSGRSIRRMIARTERQLGPVDILVVNATPEQPQHPIEEYDWKHYQQMLDYFVKSPFLLTRAVLQSMKRRRWGRIINIGSEVVHRGTPNYSAYVAAKGGQTGWTRSMAKELAPHGITVNMISPGWIPVSRHGAISKDNPYRKNIPANRWGIPDDVAGAAVFLASQSASFITGQNLHVNGGVTVS